MGHLLMENRHGLVVIGDITQATGTAERTTALDLIDRYRQGVRRITLGADKLFDVQAFIEALRPQSHTTYCDRWSFDQDWQAAQDCHRRAHAAPCRLRHQPMLPQAHRGSVRLDQDGCRIPKLLEAT